MTKCLLGFMGVGKTTVSAHLGERFVDMDALITDRIGMPISDYFNLKGEAAFRQIESQLLEDLLLSNEYQVVATGGGVVTSAKNRELLRKNRKQNILLTASFDVLYDRLKQDHLNKRPLFMNLSKKEFYALYLERKALYEEVSDVVITVDHQTPEEIAQIIKAI